MALRPKLRLMSLRPWWRVNEDFRIVGLADIHPRERETSTRVSPVSLMRHASFDITIGYCGSLMPGRARLRLAIGVNVVSSTDRGGLLPHCRELSPAERAQS